MDDKRHKKYIYRNSTEGFMDELGKHSNKKATRYSIVFVIIGVLLRYLAMTVGHNFDFESYCIVGDLASNLHNVYANTPRYNYGPIFFCIQGLCYKISSISANPLLTFRILIVTIITLGDLGIAAFLYKKYSLKTALVFFLNPISIIITGYHNQFDNLAILLVLIATLFYSEDKKFTKRDVLFILLMSASLTMKHIFFMLPLWMLLKKGIPLLKRIAYAGIPPVIFLLSFIPFIIGNQAALNGIMKNVFLYRSFNNAPLLGWLYKIINLPNSMYIVLFLLFMTLLGLYFRRETIESQVMIYLLCLVSFSSAVANQYLAIPLVALCVLGKKINYVYMLIIGGFLVQNADEFGWIIIPPDNVIGKFLSHGYEIACVLLFMVIINLIIKKWKTKNPQLLLHTSDIERIDKP